MSNATTSGGQTSGLSPNVASMLCYLCTLITGIIFLVIEKENKDVRFNAWQAIAFGVASFVIHLALMILQVIMSAIAGPAGAMIAILVPVVWLVFFVFWIVCLIKAYQGQRYKLPILGDIAEKQTFK